MVPSSGIPSVRELIAEYADLEDRMRSAEALVFGSPSAPVSSQELARLAERERRVLALLRRHRCAADPSAD